MIDPLKPVTTAPTLCKICGGAAPLYSVVDFNKSCEEANGLKLSLVGVPVYYRRCANCHFVFTAPSTTGAPTSSRRTSIMTTIAWSIRTIRPRGRAVMPRSWRGSGASTRRIPALDYGGGNGEFCTVLRESGFPVAETFDPMVPEFSRRPNGKFDLVTSFETLEHLPDPMAGIASPLESAADPGVVLFTTLVQPAEFDNFGVNWWYIGPRTAMSRYSASRR
jgi:hypothetical protein